MGVLEKNTKTVGVIIVKTDDGTLIIIIIIISIMSMCRVKRRCLHELLLM